ncbi:hypothetical protein JVU11DRAFT_609 [Chiua virens]|nr:hypothetical protein JVU11DRAFT_609 [Chiua virens]
MQGPPNSPNSFIYDSFTRVNPRKKRKGKRKGNANTTPTDLLTRVKEELEADASWSTGCIDLLEKALSGARLKPRKVLCLGLGSPSLSRDARAQLALLINLCAASDIDPGDVCMYDPVFTEADGELFQALGIRCLDHGAEYSVGCPTMLYMPHCDLKLYEGVLRANFTSNSLCNVIFIANRFQDYVDNNAVTKLERECPFLMGLVPFVECLPILTSKPFPTAFNNLALQYVTRTPSSQFLVPGRASNLYVDNTPQ